jgi:glycosyltransferase involved in cell wall biosynthesis
MMHKNSYPVLSIVTPSYNQESFIEETIKSIISQEGDFNIDYVVVDGMSTDGSVEIIRKYDALLREGKWPVKCKGINYRWVSEPDKGQSDAIEKGFRMAEGEILAYLNSDDVYLPDAFKKVVGFFGAHPSTLMIYGDSYYVDESGSVVGKYPTEPFNYDRLAVRNIICQQSAFFKRKAYEDAGGVDTNLQYVMDYDLWIRMAKKINVEYIEEYFSYFRLHEESKTMSPEQASAFIRETLMATLKYYNWAPLNRVYGYINCLVRYKMPVLSTIKPLAIIVSILASVVEYVRLNRGIRLDDLKMLNLHYFGKLFKDWNEIIKGG